MNSTSMDLQTGQTIDEKLNGLWKLEKIESFDENSDSWKYDPYFDGWNGHIVYDGKGSMGVQITPKGYQDFEHDPNLDNLNNNELRELVLFYKSSFVYIANYKINGNTIEHLRLSATEPKDFGTLLVRDFEFRDNYLILTPHEIIFGKKSRLWWASQ